MEWFPWKFPDGVLAQAEQAAQSNVPVLVVGETGTGHEGLARHIHAQSHRADGPFVEFATGAFPDSLLEAELLGHVKNIYSGGTKLHRGVIEHADGGSLFLHPIHPVSHRMEEVLKRLIMERTFQPTVGQPRSADVRVIAAAYEDPRALCDRGEMSRDLYELLRECVIEIPPLRERKDEILNLAEGYLEEICREFGRTGMVIAPATKAALLHHPWHGNLRELQNKVELAAIVTKHELIQPSDLGLADPSAPSNPLERTR